MARLEKTGFERDIEDQPAALARCGAAALPASIASLDLSRFDRIVMTGMGSSHYATMPLERVLIGKGHSAWRIQTGQLLDMPGLIAGRTLLWITSQSGRSGEVVLLLQRLARGKEVTVVATTNDPASPLAERADVMIELCCGPEATVSSKSYLNTLAWVSRAAAVIEGGSDRAAIAGILETADSLRQWIAEPSTAIADVARRGLAGPNTRFALVGTGVDAVTAKTGALILKEAAKVAAEGYVGGAFRHGPMELAGPGLTVLLFGDGSPADTTLRQLARDLAETGSVVVVVAPAGYEGAEHVAIPASSDFQRLAHAMAVVQRLSVELARQSGLPPGEFRFGQKITAQV